MKTSTPRAAGMAATRKPREAGKGKAEKTSEAPQPPPPTKSWLTTEKIVESAAYLFARNGYASSTLDDVGKHAGFTKGAVYYYFSDKESLLIEVLKRVEQRSIDTTIATLKNTTGSARRMLETFVKCQTRWAGLHPGDLAVMMLVSVEAPYTSPMVRTQVQRIYGKLASVLEEIIEAGKKSREFSTEEETRDTVLYLQAVHDGNMMIWYRSGTDPEIGRRLTRATLTGFLHAVMPTLHR